jgi:hypothetical protein
MSAEAGCEHVQRSPPLIGSRKARQAMRLGLAIELSHAILVKDAGGEVVHRSAPAVAMEPD